MTGALLSVSTTIGFGLILFAPFGAAGVGVGIAVMLTGQVLGGAVAVATCGTRGLSLGVTSALMLLLSGLVSTVAADHPGPGAIGLALAAVLSGLLVMLAGAAGAGKIIPLVPYPVLAGIVNGAAVLPIASMTWKALGPGPGEKPGLWLPVAPVVTATVVWLIYFGLPSRLTKTWIAKIPAMLLAIAVGTAVHHLLALIVGLDRAGPMLGAMPSIAEGAGNLGLTFDGLKHIDPRQLAPQIAPVAIYLVLDMRRIASIDLSGARRLVQICNRLWTEGVQLSLAYVRPGMPVWDYLEELSLLARLRKPHVFPSLDAALEAVETALLAESGAAAADALTPEAALRGLGLPDDAVAALLPHLTEVRFAPGDLAIRAGEDANSVFLLLSGRLDVTIPLAAAGAANALRTRLTTITSGTLVGEMALLSGAARLADVVARTASVCLRFDAGTVAALRRDRPEVAYHLLTCIALQINRNLRLANLTIASLEG